jgi:hypothetical protein
MQDKPATHTVPTIRSNHCFQMSLLALIDAEIEVHDTAENDPKHPARKFAAETAFRALTVTIDAYCAKMLAR